VLCGELAFEETVDLSKTESIKLIELYLLVIV